MKYRIVKTALAAVLSVMMVLASHSRTLGQDQKVALSFDNVDISVFLKTMSEITGKSFVLSEKVRGNISFVSSQDIPTGKVYDVVLSILKAQGFIAVSGENNIVNIYPAQQALKMSGNIYYGTSPLELKGDAIVTQIIPLSYATAADVVNTLRPLFGNEVIIIPYQRTNAVIASGQVSNLNLIIDMIRFLDTEMPQAQSDIHIYRLENSSAEELAQTLTNLSGTLSEKRRAPQQPEAEQEFFTQRFRVVANKQTNSLIVICAPGDWEKIRNIIQNLDVQRDQVLVEAMIVEITLQDDQTLGFDWRALIDTGAGVDALASSNTGLMAESTQTGGLYGLTVGLLNGTIPSVYAILNANKENTNFKILSTPEIVTINNQEAVITIGEQRPFLASSRVDENNNVIRTYDYKDIGITLKLTPHINKNGYITMEINQTVKKIIEGTAALENPSVYNREINSRVTVKNERTIVIGGLIRDDTSFVEQKVPVLGDIPLLGLLFRKRVKQRERTNLLIFLTPHIVTDMQKAAQLTEEKKTKQKQFEKSEKW
ncbi:MAG: secretin N-terminal domain-containing protein [Spirochaetota bacterium]